MTKTILTSLLILTLLCTAPPIVLGQSETDATAKDWQRLRKLTPGKKVSVEMKDGRLIEANFAGVLGSRLTLSDDSDTISLEQIDIQRIYSLKVTSRKKTMLIGGLVGIVAGTAIGVRIDNQKRASGTFEDALTTGQATAVYATAGGAGIGYLLGGKRKGKLLYEAK